MIEYNIEHIEFKKKNSHDKTKCDKCQELPLKWKVPFLYCDYNDTNHPDVSFLMGLPAGSGYRQYYMCEECKLIEEKILKGQGHTDWNKKWGIVMNCPTCDAVLEVDEDNRFVCHTCGYKER